MVWYIHEVWDGPDHLMWVIGWYAQKGYREFKIVITKFCVSKKKAETKSVQESLHCIGGHSPCDLSHEGSGVACPLLSSLGRIW